MATTPTPLPSDYPKVYYNLKSAWPPRIVANADEEAALDPLEWSQIPAPLTTGDPAEYPKLMHNINVPAVLVFSAEEEAQLGKSFRAFKFPDGIGVGPIPVTPAA